LTDLNKTFQLTGKMNYSSLVVSAPTEIKTAGQVLVTVVSYKINAASSDYLIGVSEDEGKTWKFAVSNFTSPLEKRFPAIKDLKKPEIKLG
jgi:hypothetical protein